jgi:HAD superfamily hydrolase (TIGR01450 family)
MAWRADDSVTIRRALEGVRAFVLDADGVLVLRGQPIPGALEATLRLTELGLPFRIVTNFSSAHRETLAARFGGGVTPAERFITGASAAAAYTAATFPDQALLVISAPDALREFDGQRLLSVEEADAAAPGGIAAVVVGDGGDGLTYRAMDVAFRAIRGGAALLAMHRNPWWLTPRGETIDAGAWVAGLEYATGRRAIVCGKPSAVVFRQAADALAAELGEPPLRRGDVVMVGDDPDADVAGAKRTGLRGVLVLTGKVDADGTLDASRGRSARLRPDAVAASLAALVAALDPRS